MIEALIEITIACLTLSLTARLPACRVVSWLAARLGAPCVAMA
ncbi:MAG: hypothetical protein AAF334_05860 [Pseudomonadota bacterium]